MRARLLVNAAGPWVDHVLSGAVGQNDVHNVRLVQGSHIVVAKKFDDPRAYFFQNSDGRIIFAIPYEDDFTLIGTTDQDYQGDPAKAAISDAEIGYLCAAASEYFASAGAARGHRLDLFRRAPALRRRRLEGAGGDARLCAEGRQREGGAPIVNVFGGKITTYRRLAESMLEKIEDLLGAKGKPWTANAVLPGGDFAATGFEAEVDRLKSAYAFLDIRLARRLVRLYGTSAHTLLGLAQIGSRPWPTFRRRPLRGRGALSDGARMGAHRRRRAVAAHQARPAVQPRGGGGTRCLHEIGDAKSHSAAAE